MCLIISAIKNKPSNFIIEKAYNDNDDGVGIVWFEGDKAKYQKGLELKEVKALIDSIDLPFVIHFRGSSIGGKSPLLCHPFEISQDSKLSLSGEADRLLIHNGTYKDYEIIKYLSCVPIPPDKDIMSDSRAIAMAAASLENEFQEEFLTKLSKTGTNGKNSVTGQKFILADAKTKTFTRIGDFFERNGDFYSNFSWEIYYPSHNVVTYNSKTFYSTPITIIKKPSPGKKNISTGILSSFLVWLKDRDDKKKYYKYLKYQDILNGAATIKPQDDTLDDIISCRFCQRNIEVGRVKTLRLINYAEHEMACKECSIELNYTKYSETPFK